MARVRMGFRTRLVLLFVLLALAPIVLLTLLYLRYLTHTIEYWQNPGIERTLENSLALARESLDRYRQEAAEAGEIVLGSLDPEAGAPETSAYLNQMRAETGADILAVYRQEDTGYVRWAAAQGTHEPPEDIARGTAEALSGSAPPPLDPEHPTLLAFLPARETEPRAFLLVGVCPPEEITERVRLLVAGVDLYRRLAAYERIQTGTILFGTLSLAALVVVASLLTARFLARSLSRPILELVEGTRRVSSGDLDHPVRIQAKGEIGLLVSSFNQMTHDLRVSKENLRRAERVAAWRDVARRIAHEIKNPLTPVQLSIHRLRKRAPSGDPETERVFTECLDLMHTEVTNLRRLADEFSQFARMPEPKLEPADLGELTRAVLDLYGPSHPQIQVRTEIPDGLPRVPVDSGQFRQALGNLIKNALEAMPSGGTLTVRLEVIRPPLAPGVTVTVADSGPGLPPEIRDRIFDPYVTSKAQGSGLGLAIVHRIVTDHGGAVEVESRAGSGTAFRLAFPVSAGS